MKKSILFLIGILVCISLVVLLFGQKSENAEKSPKLFAEGVINTSADEYNPSFMPDGKTVYFTRRIDRKGNEAIMFSRFENEKWTVPQTAEFSGKFYDKEPFVSPDGKKIFFASIRPHADADNGKEFDIWVSEKNGTGWSEAKNLGETVNSDDYDNYPSVAADGTLYFASRRAGGEGRLDLYKARFVNGKYEKAENLGKTINTPAGEADPFIAPDQSYLIFSSTREGGAGEGDLYISFNENGRWTVPQSLGKIVNTADYEYTPLVFKDKFYFSRGWGDIFEMPFKDLNLPDLRKTAQIAAQSISHKQKYLFYLHGKIVEDQGAKAVSERYGAYEYDKIIVGLQTEGFNVVSEVRPKETDVEKYAEKVAGQIRQLLTGGAAPENITVVGASKGAFITMLASTYLKNKDVNFVIIAGCGADKEFLELVDLHGNILSVYEKSDVAGSCQAFFDDATGLNKSKEVMLETGLAHGFIYKPMREWLIPTLDWANYQK